MFSFSVPVLRFSGLFGGCVTLSQGQDFLSASLLWPHSVQPVSPVPPRLWEGDPGWWLFLLCSCLLLAGEGLLQHCCLDGSTPAPLPYQKGCDSFATFFEKPVVQLRGSEQCSLLPSTGPCRGREWASEGRKPQQGRKMAVLLRAASAVTYLCIYCVQPT